MDPFKWCSRSTAARGNRLGAENAENVLLLHDQVLLAVQGDLAARVLAEQHAIAGLDVQGGLLAVLADRAFADGEDLALLRLFLDPLDQDAVVERVQGGLQCLGHGADTSSFRCVRRSRRGSGEIERHPLSWTGAARPHGDRRSRGSSAEPARGGTPRLRKISLDPLSHIY